MRLPADPDQVYIAGGRGGDVKENKTREYEGEERRGEKRREKFKREEERDGEEKADCNTVSTLSSSTQAMLLNMSNPWGDSMTYNRLRILHLGRLGVRRSQSL